MGRASAQSDGNTAMFSAIHGDTYHCPPEVANPPSAVCIFDVTSR